MLFKMTARGGLLRKNEIIHFVCLFLKVFHLVTYARHRWPTGKIKVVLYTELCNRNGLLGIQSILGIKDFGNILKRLCSISGAILEGTF